MQFGTEIHGQGTDRWDSFDDIVLTPEGLVSKTVPNAVLALATAQQSASGPTEREIVTVIPHRAHISRRANPVQEVLRHLDVDHGSPKNIRASVTAVQQLLERNLAPDDTNRLRLALRKCERRLEEHARHRRKVVQQLEEKPTKALYYKAVGLIKDDPDVSQEEKDVVAAFAARMQQARVQERAARKRARQEGREAEEREREVRRRALERERAEEAAARERALAKARERFVQRARVEKVEKLAPAVRGALKKAARESRTTTWPELQEKTGMRQLGYLDHADKVELLALVEANTAPEEPLWSTLLTAVDDSDSLRLHRDISRLLGRPLPLSDADLVNQLATEQSQLHRQR
jgi:hypothetical protein